jgi:hypothetical protein
MDDVMFDADLELLEDSLANVHPKDELTLIFREVDDTEIDAAVDEIDKLAER